MHRTSIQYSASDVHRSWFFMLKDLIILPKVFRCIEVFYALQGLLGLLGAAHRCTTFASCLVKPCSQAEEAEHEYCRVPTLFLRHGFGYLTESITHIILVYLLVSVSHCISLASLTRNSAAMEHFVACIIHSLQAVLKRNAQVSKAFKAKTAQICLQGRTSVSCLSCKQVFETL